MSFHVSVMNGELTSLDEKQVFRYMGMREIPQIGELRRIYEKLLPQFLNKVQCRACYTLVPVTIEGDCVDLSVMSAKSGNLARNLRGCSRAVLFAATLGMTSEQQRRKALAVSPTEALILDAMGSAAIEQYCDWLGGEFSKLEPSMRMRPRFSPGYGDFSLENQKTIMQILDAQRKIGVVVSEGGMMIPQKSVTAVIGFSKQGCAKQIADCDRCNQGDCEFRL